MDTEDTRVTRVEAAAAAGVSDRTINRWRAAGLITVKRDRKYRRPATYSLNEVMRVARMKNVELPEEDLPQDD